MTESIVLNQTPDQTVECKEFVTHGIYTVCAETGEVIEYDEERFFSNTEGVTKSKLSLSKSDKVYSHYERHYTLLPNYGIGTIPAKFDNKRLKYYVFAHRLSTLITNSAQKAVFMGIVQKIFHKKLRHKLYILGAFAIRYCSVDFNDVIQIIPNFIDEEEETTVRQKLSDALANLNYILNNELDVSKAEIQMRRQLLQQYAFDLLSKYGYISKIDKFAKLYNFGVIKIAVILLLLRDNRRDEAIKLYESDTEHNVGFNHFVVEYENHGRRYVRRLRHQLLQNLLFSSSLRLHSFKIML
jgi:ribosomal protein S8